MTCWGTSSVSGDRRGRHRVPEVVAEALATALSGRSLSADRSAAVFRALMAGELAEGQIGALLGAMAARGETVDEIEGAAVAMREALLEVPTARSPIDTCGTGGSGIGRRNVSTAAALAVAALGIPVAKHGNRAASSRSGSADVLEALDVRIDLAPEAVGACVDEVGIGFLFARALHPAMAHAASVRRALGVPTIFNLLGPLTNPARVRRQVMGVYDPSRCRDLAAVLGRLGAERVFVVHGRVDGGGFEGGDAPAHGRGIDDLSTDGASLAWEYREGTLHRHVLTPERVGIERTPVSAMGAGDPLDNARALRSLLEGDEGAQTRAYRENVVYAGALSSLVASDDDLSELQVHAARVRGALEDGGARAMLSSLVEATHARSSA